MAGVHVSPREDTELAPPVSGVLPRRRSWWATHKQAYMFASPALCLILLFVVFPLCYSLHLTSEQFRAAFPGAAEYLDAIKDSFQYTVPDPQIPGSNEYRRKVAEKITQALQKTLSPKEALDQAVEEWNKITKRRGLSKQQEFWKQQLAAMKESGVTFRPELADK